MQNLRHVLQGIGIVLASSLFLFGGLSLSLVEGNMTAPIASLPSTVSPSLLPTLSPTWPPFTTPIDSPTPPPPTQTPTLPSPPTNCPPPAGWVPYIVQPGDTLEKLAVLYKVSSAELRQANCLLTTGLLPGVVIYVPPMPTTSTPVPCSPPASWVIYIVQPGDTLYHLSQAFGVSVSELQRANCMSGSSIRVGQKLRVPPWATRTPSPTLFIIPIDTLLPTSTDTPIEPFTPTATDTPTLAEPTIDIPTDLPTPTATTPSP